MARTIVCPGCGSELPSHLIICPECASPLPKTAHEEQQTEPPRRQRPYAEPPTQTGDATPLHRWMDASETPDRPQPVQQQPSPTYAAPQPQPATQSFPCPSCGRVVNTTQAFCPQCGRSLRAAPPMQIYQPPAPSQVYYPVAPQPPKSGRSGGEIALIVIIALIAAMIILVKFC
ncbi:MAG TPA: hypothetical protein VGV59_15640 [Pyrinomonadaceae bacterium]|nr:hypothetical protein [Pyrinomonadaceae bacterium]